MSTWPDDLLPEAVITYFSHEATSRRLLQFEPCLVPGLLQTPAYASAVLAHVEGVLGPDVARLVDARMRRQEVLSRCSYSCIVGEAALRAVIGGASVMRAQLSHLVSAEIRVLPLDVGAHGGVFGAFVVGDDFLYLEGRTHTTVLSDPERSDYYRSLFEQLEALALTPAASAALLAQLIEALLPA